MVQVMKSKAKVKKSERGLLSQKAIDDVFEYWLTLSSDSQIIEILRGEITMSPGTTNHAYVQSLLNYLLTQYTRTRCPGKFFTAPIALLIRRDFIPEPDLVFVRKERLGIVKEKWIDGPPDLVVEILSPTTEHRDRGIKLEAYAEFAVPEYWIVDPDRAFVEVYLLHKGFYRLHGSFEGGQQVKSALLSDLTLIPDDLFAETSS